MTIWNTLSDTLDRARKVAGNLASDTTRRGLRLGVAAAVEHAPVVRHLRIGTLIDIGANKGQFSLLVRAIHPQAAIHAFEPLPPAAETFHALFAGDPRCTLHRVAAGSAPGEATMNVSARQDSSSLLPISQLQQDIFPGTHRSGSATVPVARVDDVLAQVPLAGPVLAKIDVQGFEGAALAGMPQTLARCDYVYIEVSFAEMYVGQPLADELIRLLMDAGFAIAGFYDLHYGDDGLAVQADALFVRPGTRQDQP